MDDIISLFAGHDEFSLYIQHTVSDSITEYPRHSHHEPL